MKQEIENGTDRRFEGCKIPPRTIAELQRWAKHGIMPGGFLTAVLQGDPLWVVAFMADEENKRALAAIARYIVDELPAGCWGSGEKLIAWQGSAMRNENAPQTHEIGAQSK